MSETLRMPVPGMPSVVAPRTLEAALAIGRLKAGKLREDDAALGEFVRRAFPGYISPDWVRTRRHPAESPDAEVVLEVPGLAPITAWAHLSGDWDWDSDKPFTVVYDFRGKRSVRHTGDFELALHLAREVAEAEQAEAEAGRA